MELPRAMLLDMDGTITRPMLDFARIHQEMGIGERPILEALSEMEGDRKREAEAVLLRHEKEAAENSDLNDGCAELIQWVKKRGIAMAVITRNSLVSTRTVCRKHGLEFDVLITRESGEFKPSPAPLLDACGRLGVERTSAWMVGDGQFDVEAGLAAGIKTVWVSHGRKRAFAAEPWMTIMDMMELSRLLADGSW
jgi:HAD superfamily hydrolase (TIGR01509 family)